MKDTGLRTPLGAIAMASIAASSLTAGSPLSAKNLPPASRAESVGMSSERVQRIDAKVRQLVDDGEVKGMVTLLARRGALGGVHILESSTVALMQTNTMPSPLPAGYALDLPGCSAMP